MSLILTACGGGGGSTDAPPAVPPTTITISTQPTDQSVTAAGTARFTLAATGDGLSYQWQLSTDGGKTWANVSGATGATLDLGTVAASQDGYQYRAVISGTGGASATSTAVTLKVAAVVVAPSITADVQSASVVEGQSTTLSVTAAGSNLTYKWQLSTDGSTWADVAGATSASLALASLPASADGRIYRVLVSNSAGTVTSGTANLRVQAATAAPTIASQASSVSVVAPATATFTVAVTGTPAPSLQWQQSTDGGLTFTDIAGATAASYTTAATAVSGTGARFRVVATNSAGSSVSNPVVLTVTAATAAPTFTAQPTSVTVTAGQLASFSTTAAGTPTPSYQWQLSTDSGATWTNLNGANAASYTTGVLATTDSGKRYRVVVSNSVGSTTSSAAVLTVNVAASNLSGRAWTTGQALETNDNSVVAYDAGIDDIGRTVVAFTKSDGTRTVLYAVQGTPNGAGVSPSFSTPVALDAGAAISETSNFKVSVSPNGNAAVTWVTVARCTANTYITSTSSNCNYRYVSRRLANATAWEAPQVVASSNSTRLGQFRINDAGDMLVEVQGWVRSATGGSTIQDATITWKANADSAWRQYFVTGTNLTSWNQDLDNKGNIVLVAQASQNSTTDIVAYRGSVSAGIGSQEILDQRGAAAKLIGAWLGINGQVVALWNQNNGTSDTSYAATLDSASGSWSVADLGQSLGSVGFANSFASPIYARVTDNGDFVWYYSGRRLQRLSGVWGKASSFADWDYWNPYYSTVGVNRDGSVLIVKDDSSWATFDAKSDSLIQAFPSRVTTGPGFVPGVAAYMLGNCCDSRGLTGSALLAKNGIGAFISTNTFDVLPTAAVPAGDRRTIYNAWGFYFK